MHIGSPDGATIDTTVLRRIPLGRWEGWINTRAQHGVRLPGLPELEEEPLQARPGRDRGDDFYRQVAAVYAALVDPKRRERAPAARLAELNDVPLTTAKRWIKEARRRGFLPPPRHGKAG
jgi:hypothetical protein